MNYDLFLNPKLNYDEVEDDTVEESPSPSLPDSDPDNELLDSTVSDGDGGEDDNDNEYNDEEDDPPMFLEGDDTDEDEEEGADLNYHNAFAEMTRHLNEARSQFSYSSAPTVILESTAIPVTTAIPVIRMNTFETINRSIEQAYLRGDPNFIIRGPDHPLLNNNSVENNETIQEVDSIGTALPPLPFDDDE